LVAPTHDDAALMILRRYRALAGWGGGLVAKHRAEIAHVEPFFKEVKPNRCRPMASANENS
jgi:hypothetical protein